MNTHGLALRSLLVEELFGVPSLSFTVPEGQRSFVWGGEEVAGLLNSLFAAEGWLSSDGEPTPAFLGTCVVVPRPGRRLWLADGQQRLVVIALTLAWLRHSLQGEGSNLAHELDAYLLGGPFGAPPVSRLTLLPHQQAAFMASIEAPHRPGEDGGAAAGALARAGAQIGSFVRGCAARGTALGLSVEETWVRMVRRLLEGGQLAVMVADSLAHAARLGAVRAAPAAAGAPAPAAPAPATAAAGPKAGEPAPRTSPVSPACPTLDPHGVPAHLRPPRPDAAYLGTVWVPRILFALEVNRQQANTAVSAAQIARILGDVAQCPVAPPNVARAFRVLRAREGAGGLWEEEGRGRYRIAPAGRAALAEIMAPRPDAGNPPVH